MCLPRTLVRERKLNATASGGAKFCCKNDMTASFEAVRVSQTSNPQDINSQRRSTLARGGGRKGQCVRPPAALRWQVVNS